MKIFINPGHAPDGNPDPGAVNSITGLKESDVVASIGDHLATILKGAGHDVQLLQCDDLGTITDSANSWPADYFISIHCNSAEASEAKGVEVWACDGSKAGSALAICIDAAIVDTFHEVDRGLKIATPHVNGLYVLSNTNMPAVLVETAF
ncbi:MAG: N-acetylmuramoyl-L-alanine amidase, partial [Negativicutes bacterium]|nr:N-acetylmuramoyl-L-alanine amidase [Negativicutes bacterium]